MVYTSIAFLMFPHQIYTYVLDILNGILHPWYFYVMVPLAYDHLESSPTVLTFWCFLQSTHIHCLYGCLLFHFFGRALDGTQHIGCLYEELLIDFFHPRRFHFRCRRCSLPSCFYVLYWWLDHCIKSWSYIIIFVCCFIWIVATQQYLVMILYPNDHTFYPLGLHPHRFLMYIYGAFNVHSF